jgi:hypothetical protein
MVVGGSDATDPRAVSIDPSTVHRELVDLDYEVHRDPNAQLLTTYHRRARVLAADTHAVILPSNDRFGLL